MVTLEQLQDQLDRVNNQLYTTSQQSYKAYQLSKSHRKLFNVLTQPTAKAALIENFTGWEHKRTNTQQSLKDLREKRKLLVTEIEQKTLQNRQQHIALP